MTTRNYRIYISDIISAIEDVENFTEFITYDEFINDKKTLYAVERAIEIIGEATKRLPSLIRGKYPEVPWKDIVGMRDKLSHDYNGIDLTVLWETIKKDLPKLKYMLSNIIANMEG